MLIIKLNKPNVIILKGREMIFKGGLMIRLTRPRTVPAIISDLVVPVKTTPGMKRVAKKRPNIPETT
jgi:hypothetical protein